MNLPRTCDETKVFSRRRQCRTVRLEIDYPARWAWHDHKRASRIAHGAAYASYVGSWRKRFCIMAGECSDAGGLTACQVDVRSCQAIFRAAAGRPAADIEGTRSPKPLCRSNCQPTIQARVPGGAQIKWSSSQFKLF